MNLAPVFIGTLNRASHFQKCVESLKKSSLARETHLYIGLDHPLKDEHWKGYGEIVDYLESLDGFQDLTVIKRDKNLGAVSNFLYGQEQVLNHYDRLIITEDDNCFSPNFLSYMNQGLDVFAEEKKVFGICGHNYPVSLTEKYNGNHYAWQGCSVWGLGVWRDRYRSFNCSRTDFIAALKNPLKVVQAYRIAPHYVSSMLAKLQGKGEFDPFSDAAINLHLRENGQYCVFPTLSKVRNFGHDGSGLRSGVIHGESPFATQPIDSSEAFDFVCHEERFFGNPAINRALFQYFYRGRAQTAKTLWRLLRYHLRGEVYSQ